MNILYLIGNGFDKAQGLNTSYPEFYSWLHAQKPLNDFEARIHNEIKGNYANWADLEKALGQYSNQWNEPDVFRGVIRYFNTRLKEYLLLEDKKANSLSLNTQKFVQDLCNPQSYLEGQGQDIFRKSVLDRIISDAGIDVVSFNYTSTFEIAVGERHHLGNYNSRNYYFRSVLHIHGTLDDMILVGVDNDEQIANASFRSNEDIRDEFIKPEINEGCQNTNNVTLSSLIEKADVIVLFGLSIGITDNTWWHLIGQRMDNQYNQPVILFFPYDPTKDTKGNPNYKRRWSNSYIEFLKDRMKINSSVEELKKSICVGINKDFLKLV